MRNTLAIARKELSSYFTTPWAYILLTAMVAVSSFFFVAILADFVQVQDIARLYGWQALGADAASYKNVTTGVMGNLWGTLSIIVLVIAPFLSMRLFAEEKRQKTLELLMTSPVRPSEIVLGKYLGGLIVIAITVGTTLAFPLTLSAFGASPTGHVLEWSTVMVGFGGLLLFGAVCMAVGMFISSLTESQALAGVITLVVMLCWMLLRALGREAPDAVKSFLDYVSFSTQLTPMFKGILDLKTLIFFGSVIAFSLLLTHRTVEAQRWT